MFLLNRVQRWSGNIRKFHRQITYDEPSVFFNHLVNSLNKAFCGNRLSFFTLFLIHVGLAIFKFLTPFALNTITHNALSIHPAHSSMKFCCIIPFCLEKTNITSQFALGARINCSSHVYLTASQFKMATRTQQWQRSVGEMHSHLLQTHSPPTFRLMFTLCDRSLKILPSYIGFYFPAPDK